MVQDSVSDAARCTFALPCSSPCLVPRLIAPATASAAPDLVVAVSAIARPGRPGRHADGQGHGGEPRRHGRDRRLHRDRDARRRDARRRPAVRELPRRAWRSATSGRSAPGGDGAAQLHVHRPEGGELRLQGNASSDRADAKPDGQRRDGRRCRSSRARTSSSASTSRGRRPPTRANTRSLTATVANASTGPARGSKLQLDRARPVGDLGVQAARPARERRGHPGQ